MVNSSGEGEDGMYGHLDVEVKEDTLHLSMPPATWNELKGILLVQSVSVEMRVSQRASPNLLGLGLSSY